MTTGGKLLSVALVFKLKMGHVPYNGHVYLLP